MSDRVDYRPAYLEAMRRIDELERGADGLTLIVKDGDHEARKLKERIEELEQVRDAALEELRLACVQRDDLREALTDLVGELDVINADEFPFRGVWEAFSHARAVLEGEGG